MIQNNTENMKIKSYILKIKTIKFCPCLTPCQSSMSKGHNLGYDFGSISFRAISISYFISSVLLQVKGQKLISKSSSAEKTEYECKKWDENLLDE